MAGADTTEGGNAARDGDKEQLDANIERMMQARALTRETATFVLVEGKCEQCKCLVGEPVEEDKCMCSCHCVCCCGPYLRCETDCKCSCDCPYEPESSDPSDENDEDERYSTESKEIDRDASNSSHNEADAEVRKDTEDGRNKKHEEGDEIVSETPEEGTPTADSSTTLTSPKTQPTTANQDPNHGDTSGPTGSAAHGVTIGDRAGLGVGMETEKVGQGQKKEGEQRQQQQHGQHHQHNRTGRAASETVADDTDEDMMKAPELPANVDDKSTGQLFHLLLEQLQASQESSESNARRLTATLITRTYTDAIPAGVKKKRENSLPSLKPAESELLLELARTVIINKKYNSQRVIGLMKGIALTTAQSTWTVSNINATEHKSTPANEWTERAAAQVQRAKATALETFSIRYLDLPTRRHPTAASAL